MTTKDYTYLLNQPYSLTERQTAELENILMEFPYLQSARAIYLNGLYNKNSFRYNNELKKTAAYTTDRTVLFEFITSEEFKSVNPHQLKSEEEALQTTEQVEAPVALPLIELPKGQPTVKTDTAALSGIEKLEHSIKMLIKDNEPSEIQSETFKENAPSMPQIEKTDTSKNETATPAVFNELESEKENPENPDAIGSPLKFNLSETHSFAEWLQLSRINPIDRTVENTAVKASETPQPLKKEKTTQKELQETQDGLNKKLSLIDRFIEANPKISPVKSDNSAWENLSKKTTETPGIMTETLARVYLEQKKYAKAIQAYEILILKYPEKSAFFADRILEIKDLQQNNN